MRTEVKKIGGKMFIEIPDSIKDLYQLKKTQEISMCVVERGNYLMINCIILNSDNKLKH